MNLTVDSTLIGLSVDVSNSVLKVLDSEEPKLMSKLQPKIAIF